MKNDFKKTKEELVAELTELHKKSKEQEDKLKLLNKELGAKVLQKTKGLKKSERHYQMLFNESPVPTWEEDLSQCKMYIDSLKNRNIKNFREYFEKNPDEVIEAGKKVKIIDINWAAVKLHEAQSKQEILHSLSSVFTDKSYETFTEQLICIAEGKKEYESEGIVKTIAGLEKNILLKWGVVPSYEDTLEKVYVTTTDITERKQAEEALRESEMKFRNLSESTNLGIGLYQNDYWIYANPAAEEISEYTFDELKQMKFWEFIAPEYVDLIKERGKARQKGKLAPSGYEFKIITKQGKEKWVLLTGNTTELKSGTAGLITVLDITERKQAEEKLNATNQQLAANNQQLIATEQALRESEEKYRLAFKNSPDSINITRLSDGKLLEASNSFEKITGHKMSDSLGKKTSDLNLWANPGDRDLMKEKLSRDGKIENFEFIRKMKNGYKAFSVMSAAIITIKNVPHLLSVIHDIDDLKNTEIRLRDSEARLKEAEIIAKMGNFIWDIKSGDVTWSDGLHELLGYDKSEKIDYNKVNAEIHHPDDLERITLWLSECIASGKTSFPPNEYRLLHKDGKLLHVQTTVKVLLQDDLPLKIIGSVQDITERKQAEKKLKESEERFKLAMNAANDGLYDWNLETNEIYYSPAWKKMLGYENDELPNDFTVWEKLTEPEDVRRSWEMQQELIAKKRDRFELEFKMKHKDGNWIDILSRAKAIFNNEGNAVRIIGTHVDISLQKEAERNIIESEQKHHLLLESTISGIAYYDTMGKVVLINEIGARNLGGKPDDFIGKHLSEFLDEAMTDFVMERIKSNIKNNQVEVYEDVLDLAPGKLYLSSTYHPIKNANSEIVGVQIMSTDITERKNAEEKLKESEARFKSLVQQSPFVFELYDLDGLQISVNKAYEELWNFPADTTLNKFNVLKSKEVVDSGLMEYVKRAYSGESVDVPEYSFDPTGDTEAKGKGRLRWLSTRIYPVKNSLGEVQNIVIVHQDITDKKIAEKALKESEEFLSSIVNNSLNAIMVADDMGNYISVNKAAAKMFGYTVKELHKMNVGQINTTTSPNAAERYRIYLEKGFEIGEFPFVHKNGKARIAQYHAVRVRDNFNLSILSDITDMKNAEKALKESEEKFRNIFQQSPLAIQLYNPEGNLLDVNPKTLELFGLDDKKYISGFNFWNDPNLSGKDAKALKKAKPVYISTTYNFENFGNSIQFPTSRKGLIYVDMYVMPMKSQNKIIGYLVHIVEVTEQKVAEKELIKHQDHLEELVNDRTKQLQAINKELEAFSYSVSHDLRAPLRAIDGFTRILMEDYIEKLDDEGKRLGDVIQKNAQKMGVLIDNLLAFSRLGRVAMQFSGIDMKNMANAIYHEATSGSERKRIKFSVADLPDAYGDTNMLRQVWMNLISNAIKFSSKREKAVISITGIQDDEKTTYKISDNGAGFDMKYVNKIFDVFQRLHGDKEYPGTGVGLSLVQRIIHRHKGKIWAESEIDEGATFYFTLPKKTKSIK